MGMSIKKEEKCKLIQLHHGTSDLNTGFKTVGMYTNAFICRKKCTKVVFDTCNSKTKRFKASNILPLH